MIVLGIDTSTYHGSIAIVENERLLSEFSIPFINSYSKRLISIIDDLLKKCEVKFKDIDGYAIAIGPGSFTGLRIGVSTCKGFSLATGRPVIPVGTLDAMAESILDFGFRISDFKEYKSQIPNHKSQIHLICTLIDAKKGEVFASLYKKIDGKIKKITEDMAINPERLCQEINEPTIFFGDGVKSYGDLIKKRLKGLAYFYNDVPKNSIAASIAFMGAKKLERGDVPDTASLKPKYIRRPEAEIKWEERQKVGIDF
jgi:tRNA threonylcarbamoyladenosine biosynthesis protein TsaB